MARTSFALATAAAASIVAVAGRPAGAASGPSPRPHAPAPLAVHAQAACADVAITSPTDGEAVQGPVPVFGSANIDNFSFYKLEVAPAYDPGLWSAVSSTISTPVLSGLLDVWETAPYDDGEYFVKLTAVDPNGQEVCHATVARVRVSNVATPSPSPSATLEITATPTPTFALDLVPTAAPTEVATIDPVIPITVPDEDGGEPASTTAEALATDAMGSFVKGFLGGLVIAGIGLVAMAFRRS